jgi:hypothetical protein
MHNETFRTISRFKSRFLIGSIAIVACLAAGTAQSQGRMYKCVDAKGKTYYTQTPPSECLGRDTEVLSSKSGSVVRKIEGQLTPEQQAQRDEERKKKTEQEALAKEERRKNTALLNTYSNEKDIDEARARALKENEAGIKETEKRIAGALKRKKELDDEKEFFAKKTLPAKLEQDIRNNEIDMKNQQGLLEVQKKQVSTINAKYDEDKRRYLELTKGGAKR